jgi:formylglycine-generating enzyme required for sulfatase activity
MIGMLYLSELINTYFIMNNSGKSICLVLTGLLMLPFSAHSQVIHGIGITNKSGLTTESIILSDSSKLILTESRPLYTFLLDNKLYSSDEANAITGDNQYLQVFGNNLKVIYKILDPSAAGWKAELTFENRGEDTISISNVVPFGEDNNSVYITGKGEWDLARAWLFRPGYKPVRVILPDNAWELGYSSFETGKSLSVCALARRISTEGGRKQRYETVLPPKAKVVYLLYADLFKGEWQNGLRLMFRDRYLFDLEKFDNSLFERKDLNWIKESYLIILQMAWDREFYDRFTGKYNYPEVIKKGVELFGNIDVFGIWPTWPRLGLDQRNQWDLYRDLPGGTEQLRSFVRMSHQSDTRFFIAYNPWDNSTRKEDHYKGMAQLIAETEADGVVLDTQGSSNYELQAAADSVRPGVVMYSEGMAVTKDMPGIISGRVHNSIFLSPELNLNKLIKPDFSIFRVCDVGEYLVHREIAISFFNGYGTELNMFRPGGRNEKYKDDLDYLARTTFILRQNNDAFLDNDWTPLIETTLDNVFVNRWNSGDKTIYTVLNMRPEGIRGKLSKVDNANGKHYVSLWNHENLVPVVEKGNAFIIANAEGWNSSYSGTRKEGSVDCIAELPDLIKSELIGDSIKIKGTGIGRLLIWKGDPSYQTIKKELEVLSDTTINTRDIFGYYEGKIVLQLIENKRLKDENILKLQGGKPWITNKFSLTKKSLVVPPEMVLVPGTRFSFNVTANDDFIPFPEGKNDTIEIDSFLIDKYPVTNARFFEFINSSGYRPVDTARYLKHWQSGIYRQGQDNYPVVYVSYEDIIAYAKWAEKRLPTEVEWQLAAQGPDKRKWPWGDEFHGTYCNKAFGRPTPVDAFPKGQSQYGVFDMVGNVWQLMNDIYFNGTNYFTIIRGGSYYKPESSWWYIQGGPQPLDKTQIMLMVSPGFDRSPTVGFRCVKDIDSKAFKNKR